MLVGGLLVGGVAVATRPAPIGFAASGGATGGFVTSAGAPGGFVALGEALDDIGTLSPVLAVAGGMATFPVAFSASTTVSRGLLLLMTSPCRPLHIAMEGDMAERLFQPNLSHICNVFGAAR